MCNKTFKTRIEFNVFGADFFVLFGKHMNKEVSFDCWRLTITLDVVK